MTLLLLIFATIPNEGITCERVALVEVNHVYDADGKHVLDQLIFYDWQDGDHRIIAWRLLKQPSQRPIEDFRRCCWVVVWQDGDTLRHVVAEGFRETWTTYDVELRARQLLPKEQRRELAKKRMIR